MLQLIVITHHSNRAEYCCILNLSSSSVSYDSIKKILPVSTRSKYVATISISNAQYSIGSVVNPKNAPIGVNGRLVPNAIDAKVTIVSHLPGRLLKNGTRIVLITKITSTSVQKDSINHPVWKSGAEEPNMNNMMPNVKKS